jgi:hypothetical protein
MTREATFTAVLAIPGAAGAGQVAAAPATIEKVAVNAPAGTEFTIRLECDNTAIIPPGGTPADDVDSLDFIFTVNEAGDAVPDGANTVFFDNEASCTVTETVSGGAESTSYECTDNLADFAQSTDTGDGFGTEDPNPEAIVDPPGPFCLTGGPQAEPIGFAVDNEDQEVTVTVTNTFPEPPAAEAVVIAPTFTG